MTHLIDTFRHTLETSVDWFVQWLFIGGVAYGSFGTIAEGVVDQIDDDDTFIGYRLMSTECFSSRHGLKKRPSLIACPVLKHLGNSCDRATEMSGSGSRFKPIIENETKV